MSTEDFLVIGLVGAVVLILVNKSKSQVPAQPIAGMPVGSSGSLTCPAGSEIQIDETGAASCCPHGQVFYRGSSLTSSCIDPMSLVNKAALAQAGQQLAKTWAPVFSQWGQG